LKEAGHYYTVYYVGLAAGLREEFAFKTAFYAQLPDELSELDAVEVAINNTIPLLLDVFLRKDNGILLTEMKKHLIMNFIHCVKNNREKLNLKGSFFYCKNIHSNIKPVLMEVLLNWREYFESREEISKIIDHHKDIFAGLHALTGRSSSVETAYRGQLLETHNFRDVFSNQLAHMELGFKLHAFGDSFSHRKMKDPFTMYCNLIGHMLDGDEPDYITNKELYLQYVTEMYNIFQNKIKNSNRKYQMSRSQLVSFAKSIVNLSETQKIKKIRGRFKMKDYKPENSSPTSRLLLREQLFKFNISDDMIIELTDDDIISEATKKIEQWHK